MTRHIAVVLLVGALLAAGCVKQPVDETAFGLNEDLGATAEPLDPDEAQKVADAARELSRRHAGKNKNLDKVVWTSRRDRKRAGGGGGLVRDPASEDDTTAGSGGDGSGGGSGGGGSGGGGSGGSGSGGGDGSGGGGGGGSQPAPSPAPAPYTPVADVGDGDADASGKSPAYADIRQLLIQSNGTNARVTVAVAGQIPGALGEGEVQGIGIDFYRSDDRESDYQLFATGEDDGWQAFLHTPNGVVQFPGSFAFGGRVFVFEVPWRDLGGRKPADVNMFVDWSRRATPLNDIGNDRAPNSGRVTVDPA